MLEITGSYVFDPLALINSADLFKPFWVIIRLDDDTSDYYSWFIEKRYGIKVQRPAWGSHISIIRGEQTSIEYWESFKKEYNNKPVKLIHNSELRSNGKHWWIRVSSEEAKDLREKMGYSRDPQFPFHLTIGMPTPKFEQQSFYVLNNINNFPNISHELIYLK